MMKTMRITLYGMKDLRIQDNPFVLRGLSDYVADHFPDCDVLEVFDDDGHVSTIYMSDSNEQT